MKPIIFSPKMVAAIINGSKTMTRRVIRPQPDKDDPCIRFVTWEGFPTYFGNHAKVIIQTEEGEDKEVKPYEVGDILWVRETWCNINKPGIKPEYHYFADNFICDFEDYDPKEWKWKPSIHMRQEAARLFLKVEKIRIERLQKISPEDCVAEGAVKKPHYMKYGGEKCLVDHKRYIEEFEILWDSINGERKNGIYSWKENPFVWVYEFKIHKITGGEFL
ncbi:MAG: hypothetical protein FWB73_00175 [Treponema sp.]|nr:hypothetical protein [Treponema sp.]